jgi:DNA repair photolyase
MQADPHVGRGARSNPAGRFELLRLEADPESDSVPHEDEPARAVPTLYLRDSSKSILSRNSSPDLPFEYSFNPYRGCEHGCVYCYARPTHEFLGLSAGLDFETRILVKERAPELLALELAAPGWTPQLIALSGVTDPYQPIERRLGITRRCLQVLAEFRNPVGIVTKSALVTRDIDVLQALAAHQAVAVSLSVTTLDEAVRRVMEPRASTTMRRLEAVGRLRAAGIPVGVSIAPVVPGLTDHEIPAILARAAEAGAQFATFIVLRLPYGVKDVFDAWLHQHFPARRQKVLNRVRELRDGRLNATAFGERMRGTGIWAETVERVFRRARERAGIPSTFPSLSPDSFRRARGQLDLFA